jgi:hypothetical protein
MGFSFSIQGHWKIVLHPIKTKPCFNLTDKVRIRIQSLIRICNFWEQIQGSGSVPKSHGSGTMLDTAVLYLYCSLKLVDWRAKEAKTPYETISEGFRRPYFSQALYALD